MSDLVVESCDPRSREAELKDLYSRNGKAGFAAIFDNAYQPRAEQGLRSWVGLQGERVVMHVSVTPLRFLRKGQEVRVGVLGDLMVDEGHRDFWGPARMLRKLLADVKRSGQLDLLITTTTPDAEPIFKAGGFKPFGTLRRFVMPLYAVYLTLLRIKSGGGLRAARPNVLPRCDYGTLAPLVDDAGHLRPEPVASFYETRIPRAEFADATWLAVPGKNGHGSGYALLCRNNDIPGELQIADAFWSDETASLRRVLHAAAGWTRTQRFRKLTITTLQESRAGRQLAQAGFIPRHVRSALLVYPLTPSAHPPVENWFLPSFALSGW